MKAVAHEEDSNLRVLFVSAYNPFVSGGGPNTGLYYLSKALAEIGCDVHILTLRAEANGKIDDRVSIHFFDNPLGGRFNQWVTFSIFSMKQIRELCRSYCIDVIQGRSPSTFAYALAKKEKLPFAVSVHGTSFGEIDSYFKIPRKSIDLPGIRDAVITQPSWAFLTNLEYKHANKILAVSKAVAEEAIGYYRLPKEKVVVIHNGVQLIHAREEEREENLILSAGRMTWRKGFTYLIEAMPHILKEYPKAKLLLVGDGAYKRFLEEHTKRLQLEKSVSFCGNLPREKLLHLYAKAHAYVQPSLYEPLGNTVLEAMAAERPVIATRVGGIPEIITNEKDGLLIAPQSGLQIAEAVKTIFSDVSWSKKLGENAKARVEKSFSWELAAKKTLQLYESMCAIRAPNSENCS